MELQYIRHQKAGVIIGKNQLNEGTVKLIRDHIKRQGMVKIKILKSALSIDYTKEKLIQDLISITKFHVIEKRGYSLIVSNSPLKK